MQHAALSGFDPDTLARTFGPAAFAKGFQYAQQQAVVHAEWGPSEGALRGLVRGHGGDFSIPGRLFPQTRGVGPRVVRSACWGPCPLGLEHPLVRISSA